MKIEKMQKPRKGAHSVFLLHMHLVFIVKYRRKILKKEHLEFMHRLFNHQCSKLDCFLVEFDGESDHVHLLLNYPPKVSVSVMVQQLKGGSSFYLRKYFPDLAKKYWRNLLWSPSYFAGSCGGAPLSVIKTYIQNQNTPL